MSNAAADVSLAILAGGLGTRLGGADKSLIQRDGSTQMARWVSAFADQVKTIYVCNRTGDGVPRATALADDMAWPPLSGPIAGLSAAANAVRENWLLTLPVDTVQVPGDLIARMLTLSDVTVDVVRLVDADGPQPLIALWRVAALRERIAVALTNGEHAIHRLQDTRRADLELRDFRCGNLNTPEDLLACSATLEERQ